MAAPLLPLIGAAALLITGLRMVSRPVGYLGRGFIPATDPRTVFQFGIFFLAIGVPALALIIIRLAQG